MQPLGNKVLVRAHEEKQETASGIMLPSTAQDSVQRGTVIAAGKGAATMSGDLIPMEVSEGDTVLFPRDQGIEIEFENETVLLFHETDLYCIL